jgi:hypothetical protein
MRDLIYLIAITCIMAVAYTAFNWQKKKIDSFESVIAEKNSQIDYFMNENGKLVAGKAAAEVAYSDIKNMYPELYRSLSKDLDVKVKDLKAYIQTEFKASGSGTGTVTNNYYVSESGERVGSSDLVISDGWLLLTATILDSTKAPYSYTYSDTVKQSISLKRDWILGNEKLYGSATLSNPNSKVTGSTNILIREYKDKRFSLGVGAIYDPSSGRFHLGVGVNYALFKF